MITIIFYKYYCWLSSRNYPQYGLIGLSEISNFHCYSILIHLDVDRGRVFYYRLLCKSSYLLLTIPDIIFKLLKRKLTSKNYNIHCITGFNTFVHHYCKLYHSILCTVAGIKIMLPTNSLDQTKHIHTYTIQQNKITLTID